MNPVLALARPDILRVKPYSHAAWLPSLTRLHANEVPWRPPGDVTDAGLNRYPEPQPRALVERLAALYGVAQDNLLVARGSDEAIDVLSRIYLRAGERRDHLQCTPTFGMYRVAARHPGRRRRRGAARSHANGLGARCRSALLAAWRPTIKLVYLCSPNNPTGELVGPGRARGRCCTRARRKSHRGHRRGLHRMGTHSRACAPAGSVASLRWQYLRTLVQGTRAWRARASAPSSPHPELDRTREAHHTHPTPWHNRPSKLHCERSSRADHRRVPRAQRDALLDEREYLAAATGESYAAGRAPSGRATPIFCSIDCR